MIDMDEHIDNKSRKSIIILNVFIPPNVFHQTAAYKIFRYSVNP